MKIVAGGAHTYDIHIVPKEEDSPSITLSAFLSYTSNTIAHTFGI